jgi:hypothetical protein
MWIQGDFDEDEDEDEDIVESEDEDDHDEDSDDEDSDDAKALVFMITGVTADGTIVLPDLGIFRREGDETDSDAESWSTALEDIADTVGIAGGDVMMLYQGPVE